MPEGPFGLPRLTDIGPLVSYHKESASECDREICFNGHSKEEVFRSIKTAFLSHKDDLANELRDSGIPVQEIVITGSVVSGDFGCRSVGKIEDELHELADFVWPDMREITDRDINKVKTILRTSESAKDVYNQSKREFNDDSIIMDDILVSICSDIDLFVLVSDDELSSIRMKWRSAEVNRVLDNYRDKMYNDTKGIMPYIENLESEDYIGDDVLVTEEGFNEIIRRHY